MGSLSHLRVQKYSVSIGFPTINIIVITVSYTHLDVYKRQVNHYIIFDDKSDDYEYSYL